MNTKLILSFMGLAMFAQAQTLTTAETIGKGKSSVLLASSALVVKDFTTLSFSFVQGVYGVHPKVDLYGGVNVTTALGQAQTSVTGGANINLLKSKVVSVSAFNLLTTPVNRRSDASAATWFLAAVVSRDLHVSKLGLTGYAGYSATVPLGRKLEDKLFTPPSPVYNLPVGVVIPKGKFAIFAEYNYGRTVKAASLGLAYNP